MALRVRLHSVDGMSSTLGGPAAVGIAGVGGGGGEGGGGERVEDVCVRVWWGLQKNGCSAGEPWEGGGGGARQCAARVCMCFACRVDMDPH